MLALREEKKFHKEQIDAYDKTKGQEKDLIFSFGTLHP